MLESQFHALDVGVVLIGFIPYVLLLALLGTLI